MVLDLMCLLISSDTHLPTPELLIRTRAAQKKLLVGKRYWGPGQPGSLPSTQPCLVIFENKGPREDI